MHRTASYGPPTDDVCMGVRLGDGGALGTCGHVAPHGGLVAPYPPTRTCTSPHGEPGALLACAGGLASRAQVHWAGPQEGTKQPGPGDAPGVGPSSGSRVCGVERDAGGDCPLTSRDGYARVGECTPAWGEGGVCVPVAVPCSCVTQSLLESNPPALRAALGEGVATHGSGDRPPSCHVPVVSVASGVAGAPSLSGLVSASVLGLGGRHPSAAVAGPLSTVPALNMRDELGPQVCGGDAPVEPRSPSHPPPSHTQARD